MPGDATAWKLLRQSRRHVEPGRDTFHPAGRPLPIFRYEPPEPVCQDPQWLLSCFRPRVLPGSLSDQLSPSLRASQAGLSRSRTGAPLVCPGRRRTGASSHAYPRPDCSHKVIVAVVCLFFCFVFLLAYSYFALLYAFLVVLVLSPLILLSAWVRDYSLPSTLLNLLPLIEGSLHTLVKKAGEQGCLLSPAVSLPISLFPITCSPQFYCLSLFSKHFCVSTLHSLYIPSLELQFGSCTCISLYILYRCHA